MKTRKTEIKLLYNGVNISGDISNSLINFSFIDNFNKADDLNISLADPTGLWRWPWMPSIGDELKAYIICENFGENKKELYCGKFFIDEISIKGLGGVLDIKAKSVFVSEKRSSGKNKNKKNLGSGLQYELKNKAWENVSLKKIASEIANLNGLNLIFKLNKDFVYNRVDQREQSDIAFLQGLSYKLGGFVKVSDKNLIVYSLEDLENSKEVKVIKNNKNNIVENKYKNVVRDENFNNISNFSFNINTRTDYKKCEVSYYDAVKKQLYKAIANNESLNNNASQVLKINERVESQAEAENLAINKLKKACVNNVKGKLEMIGDCLLSAGMNVKIEGFGSFDGKYFIDCAKHDYNKNSGYKTSIEMHRGKIDNKNNK